MKKHPWHEGSPPHPGWWDATVHSITQGVEKNGLYWGWWDGVRWSAFAEPRDTALRAACRAQKIGADDGSTAHVRWSHYWPENARVPRVDPRPEQAHA